MAITGYGGSAEGATTNTLTGATSIRLGGVKVEVINVKCLGDTNRQSTNLFGKVSEGPVTVVCNSAVAGDIKAVEDALHDAIAAQTVEEWTFTDGEGSTWVGNGHTLSVTPGPLATGAGYSLTAVIQPSGVMTFTPGA
jgi:hypothetical protein